MKKIPTLDKLLSKKMERKEFLLYIGLLLFGITGISGLLRNVSESVSAKGSQKSHVQGFGYGSYGGLQKGGKKLNG